jgi:hypothetical protein
VYIFEISIFLKKTIVNGLVGPITWALVWVRLSTAHYPWSPAGVGRSAAAPPIHEATTPQPATDFWTDDGLSQNATPPRAPEQTRSDSGLPSQRATPLPPPPRPSHPPGGLRLWAAARSCLLEAARYARQFPFRISVALTRVLASHFNLAPPPRLPAKGACLLSVFGWCGRFRFHLVIELIDLMAGLCSWRRRIDRSGHPARIMGAFSVSWFLVTAVCYDFFKLRVLEEARGLALHFQ